MKRLKVIACKALYREISLISATSHNFVDVTYVRQGLHDTPKLLRDALADEIRRIDSGNDIYTYASEYDNKTFDAILLGYGYCSNGVLGLSSTKYPLVVPKVDDCISLFLGSRESYNKQFRENSGTFWYNASWIENAYVPSEQNDKETYEIYKEQYGEENAKYLMGEGNQVANYKQCAYIKWDELQFPQHEKYTQDAATYYGWNYKEVEGNSSMLRDFIEGNWDDRFLIVPPNKKIVQDFNGDLMKAE